MELEILHHAVSSSDPAREKRNVQSPERSANVRANDEEYPNIFRTICIVVAVALSLFLVRISHQLLTVWKMLISPGRARHGEQSRENLKLFQVFQVLTVFLS